MNLLRQAPAAPLRCEFSSSSAAASGTPPLSRQISSARAIQASSGWSAELEREHQHGLFVVPRDIRQSLARFKKPAVGGIKAGLRDAANSVGTGTKVLEAHAGCGAEGWLLTQPHPCFGDNAEDAFGADEHPIGAWPRTGARQTPRLKDADRRHHPRALDEIVDVSGEGRIVSSRTRGDPATQRRTAVGLHVVAHRERRLAQLVFDVRPINAALYARSVTYRIDLQHLIHVAHRDRHDLFELSCRFDALHYGRAAAVRNGFGADLVAPCEDAHDVLFVVGKGHCVGRIGHRAQEHAAGVEPGLAVRVLQPSEMIGANDRLQRRWYNDA